MNILKEDILLETAESDRYDDLKSRFIKVKQFIDKDFIADNKELFDDSDLEILNLSAVDFAEEGSKSAEKYTNVSNVLKKYEDIVATFQSEAAEKKSEQDQLNREKEQKEIENIGNANKDLAGDYLTKRAEVSKASDYTELSNIAMKMFRNANVSDSAINGIKSKLSDLEIVKLVDALRVQNINTNNNFIKNVNDFDFDSSDKDDFVDFYNRSLGTEPNEMNKEEDDIDYDKLVNTSLKSVTKPENIDKLINVLLKKKELLSKK